MAKELKRERLLQKQNTAESLVRKCTHVLRIATKRKKLYHALVSILCIAFEKLCDLLSYNLINWGLSLYNVPVYKIFGIVCLIAWVISMMYFISVAKSIRFHVWKSRLIVQVQRKRGIHQLF